MSKFDDIFKARGAGQGTLPYYEDTHDSAGNFIGGGQPQYTPASSYMSSPTVQPQPQSATPMYAFVPYQQQQAPQPAPPPQPQQQLGMNTPANSSLYTTPLGSKPQALSNLQNQRPYSNMVVYEPRTPEEVQTLIDYLTRHEPAIINLDNVEADVSQRVLDFVSGATYALGGTVNRISGNIFLLSPAGVDVNTIE